MKPGDSGYPNPTSPVASVVMRANPPADTGPEVRLRSALHRAGLRFAKNRAMVVDGMRCRPDILFGGPRVVVFLDGCFWHGCPQHGTVPKSNAGYWPAKLAHNADRDRRVDAALATSGWMVVRVWEHEPTEKAVERVIHAVRG